MKEDLISFETALLAVEKGFNWKNIEILEVKSKSAYLDSTTQSLLAKWLREVHKLIITIDYVTSKGWCYRIQINNSDWSEFFNSYEEALEQGLFSALKLITI